MTFIYVHIYAILGSVGVVSVAALIPERRKRKGIGEIITELMIIVGGVLMIVVLAGGHI